MWGPCGWQCVCTRELPASLVGTLLLDGMCGVLVTWALHALCGGCLPPPPPPFLTQEGGMCAQHVCTYSQRGGGITGMFSYIRSIYLPQG